MIWKIFKFNSSRDILYFLNTFMNHATTVKNSTVLLSYFSPEENEKLSSIRPRKHEHSRIESLSGI